MIHSGNICLIESKGFLHGVSKPFPNRQLVLFSVVAAGKKITQIHSDSKQKYFPDSLCSRPGNPDRLRPGGTLMKLIKTCHWRVGFLKMSNTANPDCESITSCRCQSKTVPNLGNKLFSCTFFPLNNPTMVQFSSAECQAQSLWRSRDDGSFSTCS